MDRLCRVRLELYECRFPGRLNGGQRCQLQSLLEAVAPRFVGVDGPYAAFPEMTGGMGGGMGGGGSYAVIVRIKSFFQSGHCVVAILAASLGALAGSRFFGAGSDDAEGTIAGSDSGEAARLGRRWVVPLVVTMSSAAIAAMFASAAWILPPGAWAGLAFLLTWLVIGLVALGLIGRGRRREAWLGATFFGAGFMILAFGRGSYDPWPILPTAKLLNETRHWFADFASEKWADPDGAQAANARIHEALKQHVPMHFVDETPLEDFLKSIKKATAGADGKGIPIYVDPIGLSEADKTMTSTVRNIEVDGVPLRTSLRLCLAQLDLEYGVKDGFLFITSEESYDEPELSGWADAFQVVGHCVLALIAAGIGGVAAPVVCALAGERRGSSSGTGGG